MQRIRNVRRRGGRVLLALDFDGTLAPIVPRHEDAAMLPDAEEPIRRLAARPDTVVAVVSGRGLDDVRARVRADGIYFAGNHGFEIEGPDVRHRLPDAEALRPVLAGIRDALRERYAGIEGAEVEDKGVTLSIHYRRVASPADAERVREAAELAAAEDDRLRITHGKAVLEIRPAIDWHKGRAVDFLLETLAERGDFFPVFIGDDVTDEDAFEVVEARGGLGVVVDEDPARRTSASARVPSPAALVGCLRRLAHD